MSKLSVVIITLNEEANIGRCIDSVKGIADEVLVVDSFSTDRTCEIAAEKGAKVVRNKFAGHIEQKNFAKDQASFDYVLSLDADEELSNKLKESIKKEKQSFSKDGYTFNRLNFYCNKPVKTCGWYPDTKLRLWNKDKGSWSGTNPHDKFELIPSSSTKHLAGDLLHYTYPTHESLIAQTNKFGSIGAEHLKNEGIIYLLFKMIFSAPFKFIRNYIFKLGITDGLDGFIICYQQSREVFLKYSGALKLKFQCGSLL